jgi:hypothetical protein
MFLVKYAKYLYYLYTSLYYLLILYNTRHIGLRSSLQYSRFFYAKTLQSCKHGVHFQLCNGVSLMPSSVTSRCLNAVSYITDKHQIRNLLNNVQRVGQTSRPEHFPQNIDLILQFTGNHCMNGVLGAGIPSLG